MTDSKLSLKKVALKLKVSSPLDMSDLTVQEDIQRQVSHNVLRTPSRVEHWVEDKLNVSDKNISAVMFQLKQKLNEQKVFAEIKLNWGRQSDGKIFHEDEEGLKKTLETP